MLYCSVSAWLRKGSWPFRKLQIFQAGLLLFVCVCSSKAATGIALETIGGCEAILYIALEPVGSSQILQSVTCLLLRVLRHICLDNALFVQTVQAAHLEPLHQHLSAAAVGRGAAHWGAWGARTVRATAAAAAAVGPGWGEGGGGCCPRFFFKYKENMKWEKTPQTKIRLELFQCFLFVLQKHMKRFQGRYAHFGSRVPQKQRKHDKFRERGMFLKNDRPYSKAEFLKK